MFYRAKPGQVSYGEAIGILLLDSCAPFIPGDVANASTYSFPVRFQRVPGLSVERIFNHDLALVDDMIEAAVELKANGVRAITGDCGFMALYQEQIARAVGIPTFLSSLLQVPFIDRLIGEKDKIGIITANAGALDDKVLKPCGADLPEKLAVRGLENCPAFREAFIEEKGILDSSKVEEEVVAAARELTGEVPETRALLFECSVLAPYGAAVQQVTGLPVFDYITMINYVYSAVVKKRFDGFM